MDLRKVLVLAVAVSLIPTAAMAVYPRDAMDSGAGWSAVGTSDTAATFGYDYSAMGIPEAPRSEVGDAATTGLKLEANMTDGTTGHEISAFPTGLVETGAYVVTFDFWANVNGPFPGGGSGSTEFVGGGVGSDGVTAGRNGASLLATGEGGSSRDWRLYKNTGEQFIASGQYNPAFASNNAAEPLIAAAFPGNPAPAFQVANYAQQTGVLQPGSAGFAWHTMTITVDSNALGSGVTADLGVARFEVDGLLIGTIDNSNGGTVVDMTGSPYAAYGDLFSSVSDNAALSFGVIDNFEVIPEPASLMLLALGGLFLRRRR